MPLASLKGRVTSLLADCGVEVGGDAPWDIQVHDEDFYARVIAHGSLALGESYMDGQWDAAALDAFLFRLLNAHVDEQTGRLDASLGGTDHEGRRGSFRDRRLAWIRPRLRPHADGLDRQLRSHLAAAFEQLQRTLPTHVALLPLDFRSGISLATRPALAMGLQPARSCWRLYNPALNRQAFASPGGWESIRPAEVRDAVPRAFVGVASATMLCKWVGKQTHRG